MLQDNEQAEEKRLKDWKSDGLTLPTPAAYRAKTLRPPSKGFTVMAPQTAYICDGYDRLYPDLLRLTVSDAKQLYKTYADFYNSESRFTFPDQQRFAGTWIVAPPGRGKTNLLHNLIAEDRKRGTVVLMDSKGDLINEYRGYGDVVIIEPSTVQINPLQLGSSTRTLDFLEYIFSALLETKLTPKQTTLFRCVLALMLKVPNARAIAKFW